MRVNLFNSLNPQGKSVPVVVDIEQADDVNTKDGEVIFILTFTSNARGSNNKRVDSTVIYNVTSGTLKDKIQEGLSLIASQINWGVLESDIYPPIVLSLYPENNAVNVPIEDNVSLEIKDPFPGLGIDLDSIKLEVNNIDVTEALTMKELDQNVKITWNPTKITKV